MFPLSSGVRRNVICVVRLFTRVENRWSSMSIFPGRVVRVISGFRGTYIAPGSAEGVMSLVRLLGFTTLGCGCVIGRYREVATSREVSYVEEKGKTCGSHSHRRNHTIAIERLAVVAPITLTTKAS